MTNFQKKLTTAIATGAVLLNALAMPSFAATITITGNGSNSNNDVNVDLNNDVNVDQNNDANIYNNIDVDADTGNNDANDNTGGDVDITTGDANADVTVVNQANKNHAVVDQCCFNEFNVEISGNGTYSDNNVDLNVDTNVDVNQDNDANFYNYIDADADTGWNDANDNTGGDVTIDTGNANVGVHVLNAANANFAVVSGGDDEGGVVSALITGNGSNSDNDINLDFNSDVNVDQNNDADFYNYIDADADTGWNDANDNTGGDVSIDTGDATVEVDVHNWANFNWADIDGCGCFDDLKAKIASNGTYSDNTIDYDFDNDLDLDQDNDSDFDNDIDADADTGWNDANDNTGDPDGDPSIETGDSDANVDVLNHSNANFFGNDEFDFEWDWDSLLDWLGLNWS